jgi:hypothetical protein
MAGSSFLRSVIRAASLNGTSAEADKRAVKAFHDLPVVAKSRWVIACHTKEATGGGTISPVRPVLRWHLAPTYGASLTQLCAPPNLARFLVMAALAQLLLETAPFQQPLEAAQRRTNRFPIVDTHP